jgi:hypothetical protein
VLAIAYLLAGVLALVAGTAVLWGLGWALLVAGVLLLGLGVLEARGPDPAADQAAA